MGSALHIHAHSFHTASNLLPRPLPLPGRHPLPEASTPPGSESCLSSAAWSTSPSSSQERPRPCAGSLRPLPTRKKSSSSPNLAVSCRKPSKRRPGLNSNQIPLCHHSSIHRHPVGFPLLLPIQIVACHHLHRWGRVDPHCSPIDSMDVAAATYVLSGLGRVPRYMRFSTRICWERREELSRLLYFFKDNSIWVGCC